MCSAALLCNLESGHGRIRVRQEDTLTLAEWVGVELRLWREGKGVGQFLNVKGIYGWKIEWGDEEDDMITTSVINSMQVQISPKLSLWSWFVKLFATMEPLLVETKQHR